MAIIFELILYLLYTSDTSIINETLLVTFEDGMKKLSNGNNFKEAVTKSQRNNDSLAT